jgi:predicted ribosome quality control (RQC) complex YloA/Tae2 family protein
MRSMLALEYGYLVKELQPLVGKRFSKIAKVESGYKMKIGDADLICRPGIRLHTTKYIEEAGEADAFVEKARKELKGKILKGIEQVNEDRIVLFDLGNLKLYFEMFAKGNMILVKDGKTLTALRYERWKDREIKRNRTYKPPKTPPREIEEVISGNYIIVSLLKLPVGKLYIEELLARMGIDEKTPGIELSEEQIKKLKETLEEMKKEFRPYVFYENEKPVDFGLIKFSKYKNLEAKEFKKLSEATDEFYFKQPVTEKSETEKLERRLEKQEEYLGQLKEEEKKLKETGDYIYANYDKIEKVLETARNSKPEELEEKLSEYKARLNKKEKSIEVEV